jgi:hypothetical protein
MRKLDEFLENVRGSRVGRALPDEAGLTLPVPIAPWRARLFVMRQSGLPPKAPTLRVTHRIDADYPAASDVRIERFTDADAPKSVPQRGGEFGPVVLPPPFDRMPYDEFQRQKAAFTAAYGLAIESYWNRAAPAPAVARACLDGIAVFGKPPLLPLYMATAPAFFRALEVASAPG